MIVTVVPQRPISGILQKNKLITEKIKLDLNRNEIIRCMKYGTVYDENMNMLDETSLNKLELLNHIKNIQIKNENISNTEVIQVKEYTKNNDAIVEEKIEVKPELVKDYKLDIVSCDKTDDSYIITVKFNTSVGTIGGNIYGLFNVNNRPLALEYKSEGTWIKFNNKFANFSTLTDGDTFVFRIVPKNNSNIKFKISIKEGNEVLANAEDIINIEK